MDLFLTTTGLVPSVIIIDLGAREFIHPIIDLQLTLEYAEEEIRDSYSINDALLNGYIIIKDENGEIVTDLNQIDDLHTHTESDITDLVHDAVKIAGKEIDFTNISDGRVLAYNQSTDKIVYADPSAGSLYYDIINGGINWTTTYEDLINGGESWFIIETDLINGRTW